VAAAASSNHANEIESRIAELGIIAKKVFLCTGIQERIITNAGSVD
jgi:hypothetical protein